MNRHALYRSGIRMELEKNEDLSIVGEAENGLQLLQMLRHLQVDVIIMDISMPIMNGIQTLPIVKTEYPTVKVVIHTMYDDVSMIEKMKELGANAYLTMSSGANEVYKAIKNCYVNDFYLQDISRENSLDISSKSVKKISKIENHIRSLLRDGKSIDEIAKEVDLSTRTVNVIINKLKNNGNLRSKRKISRSVIQNMVVGLGALILGFYFWKSVVGNPINEYRLITKGKTVSGFITNANEYSEVVEYNNDRSAGVAYSYDCTYYFILPEGHRVDGEKNYSGPALDFFSDCKDLPCPVNIEYLPSNPEINRVKELHSDAKSLGEWIWRKVLLGVLLLTMFLSPGFIMIRFSIKEYNKA